MVSMRSYTYTSWIFASRESSESSSIEHGLELGRKQKREDVAAAARSLSAAAVAAAAAAVHAMKC